MLQENIIIEQKKVSFNAATYNSTLNLAIHLLIQKRFIIFILLCGKKAKTLIFIIDKKRKPSYKLYIEKIKINLSVSYL